MSVTIVRSALVSERPMGCGYGRKICGNCKHVNVGASRHKCVKCEGEFYEKKVKPPKPSKKTIQDRDPAWIGQMVKEKKLVTIHATSPSKLSIVLKISKLQAELATAIAELASL